MPQVKRTLCRAFVTPGKVVYNALVEYDPATMRPVKVTEFQRETASTTHFDGVVINGLPADGRKLSISADDFRRQVERIAASISACQEIILLPLER